MTFLYGLRVLDLTDERGLLAGRMLADLGADVVQVEPPSGSTARRRVPHLRDDQGRPRRDASYVWEAYAATRRDRTGAGCYLDVSQVEAGVWFQAPEIADNADHGTVVERLGNADREHAPHGVFPVLVDQNGYEGRRYVAIAVTSDDQWRALADAIGRPDLRDDPELASAAGRRARAVELESAVADWTSARHAAEVQEVLQTAGVPAHVSATSADF